MIVDDYIVVKGKRWRVKLSISDYSDSPLESQRKIPTSFWIQIIPAHWPKSASFGSYGATQKKFSFHDMVSHAEALSGQKITIPKRWKRYVALAA
jgi:hypothetical protein